MSLERKDAINLARVLAARLGAEPEKWGKAVEQASHVPRTNPCGASYSSIPHGEAAHTLDSMLGAANGNNPVFGQTSDPYRNVTTRAQRRPRTLNNACVEAHQFDPMKCVYVHEFSPGEVSPYICNSAPYVCPSPFQCDSSRTFICDEFQFGGCNPATSFDCHTRFSYGTRPGTPISETICPAAVNNVFTCPHSFSCRTSFSCDTASTTHPHFECAENYDCHVSFGCAAAAQVAFNCSAPSQHYYCEDIFICSNPFSCATHNCGTSGDHDFDDFKCDPTFGCVGTFSCEDWHECSPPFACSSSFRCGGPGAGDNTNSFTCNGSPGNYTCNAAVQCAGVYQCQNDFECQSGFHCPSVNGFNCISGGGGPKFTCPDFTCESGLDFECSGGQNFQCDRGASEFVCHTGHVFRCNQNFSCDTHTCSPTGAPCNEINNFGGEGGPGVFSCDRAFSGCSTAVDCSNAAVGFKCIDIYQCAHPPYDCGNKYSNCAPPHSYDQWGNCAGVPPSEPNNHGCPDLGTYACEAIDQGGTYDCPSTYQMLCPPGTSPGEFWRPDDP